MTGHIYFIMGMAGSGKGTLIQGLKDLKNENFHFPLSFVTRAMRENEIDGKNYKFITQWEFLNAIENNEFLEYAFVHQWGYYGTKVKTVYEEGVLEWKKVFKELEIVGLKKLRSERPEFDIFYSTVFLNIPKAKLKERIEKRGVFMSDQDYANRMQSAQIEEEELAKYCDIVIDATLPQEEVLKEFLKIIV